MNKSIERIFGCIFILGGLALLNFWREPSPRIWWPDGLLILAGLFLLDPFGNRGDGKEDRIRRAIADKFAHVIKEARQGNADSQRMTGLMYASGEGTPQNNEEAFFWLTLVAASCEPHAMSVRKEARESLTSEKIAEIEKRAQEWKPE